MSSSAVQPIVALLSEFVSANPTQYLIEKAFAHHQLDWRYLTFEVAAEGLDDAIRGMRAMGFRGAHIGDPHKRAVIAALDRTTETAATIGAVNLVFREEDALVGENTEGKGLLASLGRLVEPAGKHIVLLGAGRMARAAAVELAQAGPATLAVVDRTAEHAQDLVDLLAEKYQLAATAAAWQGDYEVPSETDLLIQATWLGHDDPEADVPLVLDSLRPELIVADVTADPPQTWLIRHAAERGCKTLDGLDMYIEQMAIALRLWTGIEPDTTVMREAVEEFLEL